MRSQEEIISVELNPEDAMPISFVTLQSPNYNGSLIWAEEKNRCRSTLLRQILRLTVFNPRLKITLEIQSRGFPRASRVGAH